MPKVCSLAQYMIGKPSGPAGSTRIASSYYTFQIVCNNYNAEVSFLESLIIIYPCIRNNINPNTCVCYFFNQST